MSTTHDSSAAPAILLQGVQKTYGNVIALHQTDLELASGARLALLGSSGSGKSTILQLVMGLTTPDTGSVEVLGQPMNAETCLGLRHRIGYVIQEGGLFPHLTARGNVALMARQLGWEEARITARIKELAALVSLSEPMLDRYPSELSGGQRQRVGLMRALMLDPPLLLLDEPLGALDAIVRRRLQADLAEIIRNLGKAVLLVTHDAAEARALADQIAVMDQGRILQRGAPETLANEPATPFVKELLA